LAVPITLTGSVAEPDGVADALGASQITIDLFASEATIVGGYAGVLALGGDVHWRNRSGETRTVTSPIGVLDSGPIPDGGSFHASLPVPGIYVWTSEFGEGSIVVEADFTGEVGQRALDHIPDVAPPARDPNDIGLHPDLAVELSRTTAIIGFTDTATVQQARQALGSNWDIVGGLPEFGLVYAKIWVTSNPINFRTLDSRIAQLRQNTAVEFVSFDFPSEDLNVSPPSIDGAETRSYWEPPQIVQAGLGDNWGLEVARLPQAWNLRDATRLAGGEGRGAVVAVDSGFQDHVDLSRLQRLQYCATGLFDAIIGAPGKCTTLVPSDHGNQIAGIIGADYDDVGVTGADPYSRLYGLPWRYGNVVNAKTGNLPGDSNTSMQLLLRAMAEGRLTDVNAVNLSFAAGAPKASDWWAAHAGETCGPGPNDDDTGTEICYPDTHDGTIAAGAEYGKAQRRIFEAFVEQLVDPPLFVAATGNDSLRYCTAMTTTDPCDIGTGHPFRKLYTGMQWAADNWDSTVGENPIITVESIGELVALGPPRVGDASLIRSAYSNVGGDVSVSGMTTSTTSSAGTCLTLGQTGGADGYCFSVGTSNAAPMVAGIAGVLSSWDPSLSAADLKARIITWSLGDTTDGAAPRVDAFASLLSLDGVAHALADVNDPSIDGNRRVVYEADGTTTDDVVVSTTAGFTSDPDGVVDLRDFRRFRDAWLLRCQIDSEAGCPTVSSIALDGAVDHPKRDLNGDGCILLARPQVNQTCPSELTFPRFDFNGDGGISRNDASPVALRPDGTPAAGPGEASSMTDLQVFATQWDEGAPGALGVTASDLAGLLSSGDLTLVADGLQFTGAPTISVALVDHETDATINTYAVTVGSDDAPVVTIPAGQRYRLDVEASGPTGSCSLTIGPFSVRPGEDRRVDLDASLTVSLASDAIRPNGQAEAIVTASSCEGDVDGVGVDLAIDPDAVAVGGAFLDSAVISLGPDGTGSAVVSGGELRAAYELGATATIPIDASTDRSFSAKVAFTVGEPYALELAAIDDEPSGYFALDEFFDLGVPVGPSVNGHGDIGFGALVDGDDRYRAYRAEPGDAPGLPAEADAYDDTFLSTDTQLTGQPELNDARQIAYTTIRPDGSDTIRGVYRADPDGTTDELATALSTLGATSELFSRVARPTINESGDVIFVATDQAGTPALAERQGALVVVGLPTAGARPQLADDGTTVAQATVTRNCVDHPGVCPPGQTVLFDPIILVGDGVQPARSAIAEGRVDGFGALSAPDISPPGDAIVFVGDLNDTAGLFVSIRTPGGSWQAPVAIEGPSVAGDLAALVLDRPTVAQISSGPVGPEGDRLLISVRGNERDSGGTGPEAVVVVPVDIRASGDALAPYALAVGLPVRVAQIGDVVGGRTISRLDLGDSLALATSPAFAGDHWVAFYAEAADGSNMHVRAQALPAPEAAVVPGGPGNAIQVIRPSGGDRGATFRDRGPFFYGIEAAPPMPSRVSPAGVLPDDVEVLPGPHVAAVTVDNDTPTSRVPARIVNRSRSLDGTPAWGLADESGTPHVLLNPEPMGPDSELFITYPNRGTERLLVGAPLSSGEFAISVTFTVVVKSGANRPPIGEISDGPHILAPGSSIVLRAAGTDPDGDRMSYTWDLDDDGVFDNGDFLGISLSGADVQATVCGGACVLEQPYPVKVRILDERGLDVFAQSTITVSGFSGILLRVDPELMQANPGSSSRSYVFVDKPPGDPSIEVQLTIENEPADWTVSVTDDVMSGETGLLSVRVPDNELEDSFSFDVVAKVGDVSWRSTVTVVTLFGLIPECSTTVQGTVTDELGDPVRRVTLNPTMQFAPTVETDADGFFSYESILPQGASVERFFWSLTGPSGDDLYVNQYGGPNYARCDETLELNPVIERIGEDGGITMRAVAGIENPVTPTRPLATDEPMEAVTFTISYQPERFRLTQERFTTSDGRATFPDLPTGTTGGRDMYYNVSAWKTGFWSLTRSVQLSELDEGQLIDAGDFPMIPACLGKVGSARVVDQYGDPVEGASIWISSPRVGDVRVTPSDGAVTFDEDVFLGKFNRPRLVTVRAEAPRDWGNFDVDVSTQQIGSCGDLVDDYLLELERPEPEIDYFGTIVGTVVDADTAAPMEGVRVNGSFGTNQFSTLTDAAGNWTTEVFTGTDPADVGGYSVRFQNDPDYWLVSGSASVPADGEVRVDAEMFLRTFVTLSGTVTDAETGNPIEGARVVTSKAEGGGAAEDFTDVDGKYTLPDLGLSSGIQGFPAGTEPNAPRNTTVSATFDYFGAPDPEPYWFANAETTLTEGEDQVLDIEMIPVCADASVSGLVVNAATLEPLEGVDIFAAGLRTLTDAQGRYHVTGIRPGFNNDPRNTSVIARKTGFFDATIDITTYCGAELVVDFGRPFGGFGTVVGTVTDLDSGDPLPDVFVGTAWGDSTTTASDGTYAFDRAPLTSDGEARDWIISATRGFDQLQQVVAVSADADAVADFAFGVENLPPDAFDQNLATDTETGLSITLTGNDPEGESLTFTVVDAPTLGALTGDAPNLTYAPTGTGGDDSLTFRVNDGEQDSELATVSIAVEEVTNVRPVISAPTAVEVSAGSSRQIGVTAMDDDGDPLDFSVTDDGGGRASLSDAGDGTAVITVNTDLADADQQVSVSVQVSDGELDDSATIVVTIVADDPVNRPPDVSIVAPGQVDEGTDVLFNASTTTDPDGDPLSFAWTLVDFDGSTIATGSGAMWSHEFPDDFIGAARLVVTDARGESAEAESEIIVINVPPAVEVEVAVAAPDARLIEAVEVEVDGRVAVTGSFSDPGADQHQVVVDWGDGTSEPISHEAGAFAANHTYTRIGPFTFVVEVCDDDQGCGRRGDEITVRDDMSTPPPADSPVTTKVANPVPTTTVADVPATIPVVIPAPPSTPHATLPATGSSSRRASTLTALTLALGLALVVVSRSRRRRA
jgi:hypothetical protein